MKRILRSASAHAATEDGRSLLAGLSGIAGLALLALAASAWFVWLGWGALRGFKVAH
jgi:hypothetical protein